MGKLTVGHPQAIKQLCVVWVGYRCVLCDFVRLCFVFTAAAVLQWSAVP